MKIFSEMGFSKRKGRHVTLSHTGFIGVGHMGGALLRGLLKAGSIKPEDTYISGGTSDRARRLAEELGVRFCRSNAEVAKNSDRLILGILPSIMKEVLLEIRESVSPDTEVISLAASFPLSDLQRTLGADAKLARALPNLPVAVCSGMTAVSFSPSLKEAERSGIRSLFESVGRAAELSEDKLAIASAISGCSPAFVAVFAEAMADAGVYYGLSRKEAYLFSEQAISGTTSAILSEGILPAEFKDRVASPGGTTIKGLAALEQYGFRNAVIQAIHAINR